MLGQDLQRELKSICLKATGEERFRRIENNRVYGGSKGIYKDTPLLTGLAAWTKWRGLV